MVKNKEIVGRVTRMVLAGMLSRADAADLLETSVRTIGNYKHRFIAQGLSGFFDRRHGTYRKLSPEAERQIVECKRVNPARSALWIRNRLKLDVSEESVRRVLVKHNLQRRNGVGRQVACNGPDFIKERRKVL